MSSPQSPSSGTPFSHPSSTGDHYKAGQCAWPVGAGPRARPVGWCHTNPGGHGGPPDPASFPYQGIVAATAEMMEVEGADALTYGDPQGYAGLRDFVCRKYEHFDGLKLDPENILITNGSGHAISLVISAFVDVG